MNKIRIWNMLMGLALLITACATPTGPSVQPSDATATVAATPTSLPASVPASTPTPMPMPTTIVGDDEIIAYEMRAAFDFFWEQANTDPDSPGYGLIRDRYPGSAGIASIASVGFGLTALIVGVERGYITRDEGYERASGTLQTLTRMESVEGFYYHFVDIHTGQRAWQSEVSSIDTAILLMGVLAVGHYFGAEVATLANTIYERVNWPWFLDPDRQMFYMAYYPEKGFSGYWDFYAEQLMLYVLAAASPTYPVDETPYYTFIRHTGRYGDGEPFIHSWFGSIFTYQFSHAWIDFRGLVDQKGVDWFQNSVAASRAHYDFAVAMDAKYETIGPNAWGLTACDGPNGYEGRYGAPPSGYDNRAHFIDDTVPPAGAIGSIIFTPAESLQAMRFYYSLEQLKGQYGFYDAFNLSRNWYATDVIGIDKGISLVMLANYQDDLIHRVMMSHPIIQTGLTQLGIAAKE
ncbi:glucoamylase family protein [Chloroflexus sp.]|uniref:glucoamylase family protein n=1 Tax=Chloroflexus sp. TaxID=1904827 RepID=UPI002608612A|nr:glucoamylase family protein [uncultured Chloroflexus sp.]